MDDTTILIIIIAFCLELIIAGIIGLKTKRIKANNLAMNIIFFPLGIMSFLLKKMFKNTEEEGKAAVSASIGAIVLGSFVLIALLMLYLGENINGFEKITNIFIPTLIVLIIIGMIISIIKVHNSKTE